MSDLDPPYNSLSPEIVWQDHRTARVTVASPDIECLGGVVLKVMKTYSSTQANGRFLSLVSGSFDVFAQRVAEDWVDVSVKLDRSTASLVFVSAIVHQKNQKLAQQTAIYRRS